MLDPGVIRFSTSQSLGGGLNCVSSFGLPQFYTLRSRLLFLFWRKLLPAWVNQSMTTSGLDHRGYSIIAMCVAVARGVGIGPTERRFLRCAH
jgi:hypothetical protein